MAEKELAIKRLQQRHDTAQNWKVKNPILAEGELGVETDTGNIKAGNGTTTWNSLPYSNAGLGGGSSEDCLKTTGGVLNGNTVISEATDSYPATVGTVFEASTPNAGISLKSVITEGEVGGEGKVVLNGQEIGITVSGASASGGSGATSLVMDAVNSTGLGGFTALSYNGASLSNFDIEDFSLTTIALTKNTVQLHTDFNDSEKDGYIMLLGNTFAPICHNGTLVTSVNGYHADVFDGNIEIPSATTAKAGLMSSADKAKLDGLSGGTGSGDDGYFPSNVDMTIADAEDDISELSGGGYIMGYKVYDPATSTHLPLKHIVAMGYSGEHTMVMTIAADTFEEIINIANSEDGFMALFLNGASFGVLAPITLQDVTIGMGCIKCVNATEKPLWFLAIIPDFASVVMPMYGYY